MNFNPQSSPPPLPWCYMVYVVGDDVAQGSKVDSIQVSLISQTLEEGDGQIDFPVQNVMLSSSLLSTARLIGASPGAIIAP